MSGNVRQVRTVLTLSCPGLEMDSVSQNVAIPYDIVGSLSGLGSCTAAICGMGRVEGNLIKNT
jgi:hypothetical protein